MQVRSHSFLGRLHADCMLIACALHAHCTGWPPSSGALAPLVEMLRTGDADDQEVVAMVLANLSGGAGEAGPNELELGILLGMELGGVLLSERQRAIVHSGASS